MGAPFSRPAGHRQSVWEQEPRARRRRGLGHWRAAAGAGLAACRWRGGGQDARGHGHATAGAGGSGPEQGGGRRAAVAADAGTTEGGYFLGGRLCGRALRSLLGAAAPNGGVGGRGQGKRTRDLSLPRSPGAAGVVRTCANCCHFAGLTPGLAVDPSVLTAVQPKLPSRLRRWGSARRALGSTMRLGTCLATLAGLLLTAAGDTFSGKRGGRSLPALGAPGREPAPWTPAAPKWQSPRRASERAKGTLLSGSRALATRDRRGGWESGPQATRAKEPRVQIQARPLSFRSAAWAWG